MPLPRWFLFPEGMILVPHDSNLVVERAVDQRHSSDRPPKVAIALAILVSMLILLSPVILGNRGISRFFSHRTIMRDSPERTLCLTPEALDLMPVTKFRGKADGPKSGGGGYSPEQPDSLQSCSICTEDFGRGVEFRPLPCGHRFHPACIDPWLLQRSLTCPLCRLNVATGLISSSRPEAPAHPRRVLFLTDLWAHRRPRPRGHSGAASSSNRTEHPVHGSGYCHPAASVSPIPVWPAINFRSFEPDGACEIGYDLVRRMMTEDTKEELDGLVLLEPGKKKSSSLAKRVKERRLFVSKEGLVLTANGKILLSSLLTAKPRYYLFKCDSITHSQPLQSAQDNFKCRVVTKEDRGKLWPLLSDMMPGLVVGKAASLR